MPVVNLVARNIGSLQPIKGQRTDYHDNGSGLVLRVSPTGARVFSVVFTFAGKVRRYTLGSAHRVDLADAREAAKRVLAEAALGSDPQLRKVQDRRRRLVAISVDELVGRFLEARQSELRPNTVRGWQSLRRNHIRPGIGQDPAASLARATVRGFLSALASEHRTTSNRVLELLRVAYGWAMDQDPPLVEASPCAGLKKLKEAARERVLTAAEVGMVWRASEAEGAQGAAIRLLLLSGQRPGEVLGMKASEVDLEAQLWRVPSERMKAGRPHVLPLTRRMAETIRSASQRADYVFESQRLPGTRLATLQHAHTRIQASTGVRFQIRDLRRTVRSGLSEIGVSQEIAERILAHVPPGLVATYDRHVPLLPMRDALERWGRHLETVVSGKRPRKPVVMTFPAGGKPVL